jgi:diaminopimelate epimerase
MSWTFEGTTWQSLWKVRVSRDHLEIDLRERIQPPRPWERFVRFWKYQAHGNEYVVLDAADGATPSSSYVQSICDRSSGAGADGVLYGPIIENNVFGVRIFNPDGSEAEKSGNGVRIFARWLKDRRIVQSDQTTIRTVGGDVPIRYLDQEGQRVAAEMGRASFWSDDIPLTGSRREVVAERLVLPDGQTLCITCLTIGNPHCVILVEEVKRQDALTLGPTVERHAIFPNRTNMQLVEIINRRAIRIEIWERGAGRTLASGSSSCAAACAVRRLGLVDAEVRVEMPGGEMFVEINDDWRVALTGEAEPISEGNFI